MNAAYGTDANVLLKEWNRKGWTYHAKGRFQRIGFVDMGLSFERNVDTTDAFITSYDDSLWFYEPELSIVESRHRTVVYHDDPGKQRR